MSGNKQLIMLKVRLEFPISLVSLFFLSVMKKHQTYWTPALLFALTGRRIGLCGWSFYVLWNAYIARRNSIIAGAKTESIARVVVGILVNLEKR